MKTVGCVIPCYKGSDITLNIIKKSVNIVDYVVLIDDGCPNKIGELASKTINNEGF